MHRRQNTQRGSSYALLVVSGVSVFAGLALGYAFALWQCQGSNAIGHLATSPNGRATSREAGGGKWQEARVVCTNTCLKAKDGVCNDGSSLLKDGVGPMQVFCDLGTDCQDCGPWQAADPVSWSKRPGTGPVAQILARGLDVFARRTSTTPPFVFAYTNPAHDVDVSAQVHSTGLLEPGITKLVTTLLSNSCTPAGNESAALFADVGANFGFYSILAAVLGCRVVAWEPVTRFSAFMMYNLAANGVATRVDVRNKVVAEVGGKEYEVIVPQRGIWGTAGIGGKNIDHAVDNKGEYEKLSVAGERLDDVLAGEGQVLLLKLDVEGFEAAALASADTLTRDKRITHIVMEYSPGVRERDRAWEEAGRNARVLDGLIERGHSIAHLGSFVHNPPAGPALPTFEEVTRANLKYDLQDMERIKVGGLGCPAPAQLAALQPQFGCGGIPEHLHPKSFRSMFAHNTNVWISTQRPLLRLLGTVGVLPLDVPMTRYFTEREFGQGGRMCRDVPPEAQVQHRCRCAALHVCGALQANVSELAGQGLMGTD